MDVDATLNNAESSAAGTPDADDSFEKSTNVSGQGHTMPNSPVMIPGQSPFAVWFTRQFDSGKMQYIMQITLNGNSTAVSDQCTIAQLLQDLQIDHRYCAVEVNRQVIPREQHAATQLHESDELEVVTLVGGG